MDPALIAAWAAVVATLIASVAAIRGPIISVKLAHEMMERHERLKESAQLIRQVVENGLRFSIVSANKLYYFHEIRGLLVELESNGKAIRSSEDISEDAQHSINSIDSRVQALRGAVRASQGEMDAMEVLLNADMVSLSMLYGEKAKLALELEGRLLGFHREFYDPNDYDTPLPSDDELKRDSIALVQSLLDELESLHKSI